MSGFTLKIIALASMVIDHFGYTFENNFNTFFLRVIGRMAFPIFGFFIAESARKTRSMGKYILRLAVFAMVSEICFDAFLYRIPLDRLLSPDTFLTVLGSQNTLFTLLLGATAIFWFKTRCNESLSFDSPKSIFNSSVIYFLIMLGAVLRTDYGSLGVAIIFAVYYFKDRTMQITALIMWGLVQNFRGPNAQTLLYFLSTAAAVALIYFYNGKRGLSFKWLFYVFYPAHLLALYFIGLYLL